MFPNENTTVHLVHVVDVKRTLLTSTLPFITVLVLVLSFGLSTVGATPYAHAATAATAAPRNVFLTSLNDDDLARMEAENDKILQQLQILQNEMPTLESQIAEVSQLLAESEQLIPAVEKEVADAKEAATIANEVYIVRENETVRAEAELEKLTDEVNIVKGETEKLQSFVSNVARDMYIQGVNSSPQEMQIVLTDEDPSVVVSKIETTRTVTDKAGVKVNAQVEGLKLLEAKTALRGEKFDEVERLRASASAQKNLAENNAQIAADKEAQLKQIVVDRNELLAELETQKTLKEVEASDLSTLSLKLAEERNSLKTFLTVKGSVPITEAAPDVCPKVAPGGTNWDGVDVGGLCVAAVASAPTTEAQRAILYAFNHLGSPYSQGNRLSVKPPVFDCSSFVARAYNAGGAYISKNGKVYNWINMFGSTVRYTPGVYEGTNLKRVTKNDPLKPGDVFIQFNGDSPANSGGDAGHAQMYLGVYEGDHYIIQSGGGRDSKVNVSHHRNSFNNEWVFRYTK